MKAKARQVKSELKSTKKGTRSVTEYVSQIRDLSHSLTVIGAPISESDLCDVLLDGLSEEYSPFVKMMYGKSKNLNLTDLESLLLIQEAQFDKFKQELTVTNASANLARTNGRSGASNNNNENSNPNIRYSYSYGRGRGRHGRGRGRGRNSGRNSGNAGGSGGSRPTCQLCGKYGHAVADCWHRFDENFVPPPPSENNTQSNNVTASKDDPTEDTDTVNAFLASAATDGTGNLRVPNFCKVKPQHKHKPWKLDSGASHSITPIARYFHRYIPYRGNRKVFVGNGSELPIAATGCAKLISKYAPHTTDPLNPILMM